MRRRLGALTGSGALPAAGLVAVTATPAAAGLCGAPVVTTLTTTVTCTAGRNGSLTVPDHVTSAQVVLDGAGGGPSADRAPGGKVARVEAVLAVPPGSTLYVTVGSKDITPPGHRSPAGARSTRSTARSVAAARDPALRRVCRPVGEAASYSR